MSQTKSAERVVRDIRRKTRRRFSAEEKIRIVLEGLRGEESIAFPFITIGDYQTHRGECQRKNVGVAGSRQTP